MTVLYLVRHAKPAATWGEAVDPGLDDLGRSQAEEAALALRGLGTRAIYTSPLQRCRETAVPLSSAWNTTAIVLPAVAEIPSPPLPPAGKQKWLHDSMQGTWAQLQAAAPPGSPDYLAWRARLLTTLRETKHDSVIFSHYIAINVAVGAAQGNEKVISFRPAHASVTAIEVVQGQLAVRELGKEATDGILLGR